MSWATKGFEAAEEQVAANSQSFTREFFFKAGEDVSFRFIDDEPVNLRDHFVMGKGWFTCIQGIGDEVCPLCEAGNKATNHFVFNVFDPREYTKKTGETVKGGQVKIWRVGITLLRMLDKKRAKYGPLSTLAVEISKMGQGQSTAYNIEVEKAAKALKLPEGQEPYDLMEVLAPKSRKELIAILNNTAVPTSAPDEDDDDDDEDDIDWKKS
jgi:hypothetical protein